MKQERVICELMECMRKAAEKRINEITAQIKQVQETEEAGNIKAMIGQKAFLVNETSECYEVAHIKEVTYKEEGIFLRLETALGKWEPRHMGELGKTIFFTEEKARAALKVDEEGNPINTYLTEFIKRFPERKGKEREIIDKVCRSQVFGLQDCQSYTEDRTPADCQACWNQPYKEGER